MKQKVKQLRWGVASYTEGPWMDGKMPRRYKVGRVSTRTFSTRQVRGGDVDWWMCWDF